MMMADTSSNGTRRRRRKIDDDIAKHHRHGINSWEGNIYIYRGGTIDENDKSIIERVHIDMTTTATTTTMMTEIDDNAFESCISLKSIEIPYCIQRIGHSAFKCCRLLKNITFSNQQQQQRHDEDEDENENDDDDGEIRNKHTSMLQIIGNDAFHSCHSLKYIEIPKSVHEIGECAFHNCSQLRQVKLPMTKPDITSITESQQPELVLEVINEKTFSYCYRLNSIILPDTIKVIKSHAFSSCTHLQSIYIPNTLVTIGEYAFHRCRSLSTMTTIKEKIDSNSANVQYDEPEMIKLPASIERIGHGSFARCSSIISIEFPTMTMTTTPTASMPSYQQRENIRPLIIDEYAFSECTSLRHIQLPKNQKRNLFELSSYMFHSCRSLLQIDIPTSVRQIGSYTFYNCQRLQQIVQQKREEEDQGENRNNDTNDQREQQQRQQLASRNDNDSQLPYVRAIGKEAFHRCSNLCGNIKLSSSIKYIGRHAFARCYQLECVSFSSFPFVAPPDTFSVPGQMQRTTSQQQRQQQRRSMIQEIEDGVFTDCTSLKGVINLPNTIMKIGKEAFVSCSALSSIQFSNRLQYIGSEAFLGCSELQNILITDDGQNSNNDDTDNNRLLHHLPTTLVEVGSEAFEGCPKLSSKIVNNPAVHYICDTNRGGGRFLIRDHCPFNEKNNDPDNENRRRRQEKRYPSSLWPLIIFHASYKMDLPKHKILRRHYKNDTNDTDNNIASNENVNNDMEYIRNEPIRRISVVYHLMVHGIAMEYTNALLRSNESGTRGNNNINRSYDNLSFETKAA